MLVVTRTKNTSVSIGEDVLVTVRGFRQEQEEAVLEVHCAAGMTVCGPDAAPMGPSPAGDDSRESGSRYFARLKVDQCVTVGGDISVMIVALLRNHGIVCGTRLGVKAPKHMRILRPDAKCAGSRQGPPDDEPPPGG